jgi:hypothetical protein
MNEEMLTEIFTEIIQYLSSYELTEKEMISLLCTMLVHALCCVTNPNKLLAKAVTDSIYENFMKHQDEIIAKLKEQKK